MKLPAGHKLVVTPHSAPMSTLPSKRNVTHAPKTQPVKCAGKPKFDASGRRVWRRLARRCSHCGCARCPASHPAGTCSATDGERMYVIFSSAIDLGNEIAVHNIGFVLCFGSTLKEMDHCKWKPRHYCTVQVHADDMLTVWRCMLAPEQRSCCSGRSQI